MVDKLNFWFFGPKIDFWLPGLIFGQKLDRLILAHKLIWDLLGSVFAQFWSKIELSIFWQKIDFWPPRSIFSLKIEFFICRPENWFEIFWDHFLANFRRILIFRFFGPKFDSWPPGLIFGRKIEFSIFWSENWWTRLLKIAKVFFESEKICSRVSSFD